MKKSTFVQRNGFDSSNWVAEHDVFIVRKSERPHKSSTFVISPPFFHFSHGKDLNGTWNYVRKTLTE